MSGPRKDHEEHGEQFESQRARLLALAHRWTGSAQEAEDIVSEAWLRWLCAADVENPAAFLTTVVHRLCADHLKSAHTQRVCYVGASVPDDGGPEHWYVEPFERVDEEDQLRGAVTRLLERLAPAERAVLVLREAFGYSHREIAGVLRISEAYSRKLYGRARDRLLTERARFTAAAAERSALTRALVAASRRGDLRPLENLLAGAIAA